MQAELTHQLGYPKNEVAPESQSNRRNGASLKKVKSSSGELQIEVPRDRDAQYEMSRKSGQCQFIGQRKMFITFIGCKIRQIEDIANFLPVKNFQTL